MVSGSYGDLRFEFLPRPPHVPLLRAFWPLLDGIWGLLKGTPIGSNCFIGEPTPLIPENCAMLALVEPRTALWSWPRPSPSPGSTPTRRGEDWGCLTLRLFFRLLGPKAIVYVPVCISTSIYLYMYVWGFGLF